MNLTGDGVMTLTGNDHYPGNTTVDGATLKLSSAGRLTVTPTGNGNSNKLTGTGTVALDGGLIIDLSTADTTNGNVWTLVDVGTLAVTFDPNFQVVDFAEQLRPRRLDQNHFLPRRRPTWTFTESTGQLTVATGGVDNYAGWASTHGVPGEPATGDFEQTASATR